MVGSIDPRCETLRGTHWPAKVAGVFGTRVAENHLGQRSTNRTNRPDIWMQAIRSDHHKTLAAREPSTYGSRRGGRDNEDYYLIKTPPSPPPTAQMHRQSRPRRACGSAPTRRRD